METELLHLQCPSFPSVCFLQRPRTSETDIPAALIAVYLVVDSLIMDSAKPVRSQSPWLTVLSRLDNVPNTDHEDQNDRRAFFNDYWNFLVHEEAQRFPTPVGHIADWLADKVNWGGHPRFRVDRNSRALFLDAKQNTTQRRGAVFEGTKALHVLLMELLDGGSIPGFDHFHRKNDCCQIPSLLDPVQVDRNAAQLFGLVTMGSHMACYTWVSSEEGRQMMLWVPTSSMQQEIRCWKHGQHRRWGHH